MVRIALISDIHFGKLSRVTEFSIPGEKIKGESIGAESLEESLINILKKKKVEYIFVAGDLTSEGSPDEFYYFEEKIISIAQKANIEVNNIILGLGNHDIDWKITRIYEDYEKEKSTIEIVKDKYRLLGAYASVFSMEKLKKPESMGPAPFNGIVEKDEFIMFILNSGWCCTHDQKISHGKLDDKQIKWFEQHASEYEKDKRWKIVLMHHHIFNYKYNIPVLDVSMLEESGDFLEIIGKNGVDLVLHGHRHHPKAETSFTSGWKNPITFVCAGSLTVNADHRNNGDIPNTFHVLELGEDVGVLKLENFQYSSAEGWIPIKNNCSVTPLDPEMWLGKVSNEKEIEDAILKLPKEELIKWNDINDCLRFLSYDDLNKKVSEHFIKKEYKMIGKFPEDVYLIRGEN